MDPVSFLSGPAVLIHLAAGIQVLGYLVRDQLVMRLALLTGTVFYVLYYIYFPATPLWEAALWSTMMGLANSAVVLVHERSTWRMSEDDRQLLHAFHPMRPGEFRRFMRAGTMRTAECNTLLTVEGERLQILYYVVDGEIWILKQGRLFRYPPGAFMGEIAYVAGRPASATVKLSKGARYVAWDRERLRCLTERKPAMFQAIQSLLVRDMAEKIARS